MWNRNVAWKLILMEPSMGIKKLFCFTKLHCVDITSGFFDSQSDGSRWLAFYESPRTTVSAKNVFTVLLNKTFDGLRVSKLTANFHFRWTVPLRLYPISTQMKTLISTHKEYIKYSMVAQTLNIMTFGHDMQKEKFIQFGNYITVSQL